jgi:hypothetical protein
VSVNFASELNVAAKSVPKLVSVGQKERRGDIYFGLKEQTENDPNFTSTDITAVESRDYGYNPETKQHSSQWKSPDSPRSEKAQVRNNVRSEGDFIFSFTLKASYIRDFVLPGQIVRGGKTSGPNVQSICATIPGLCTMTVGPTTRQSSSCSLTTVISTLPTHHTSPLVIFPQMKWKLKLRRFDSIDENRVELQDVVKLTHSDFQCFRLWKYRCDRCGKAVCDQPLQKFR